MQTWVFLFFLKNLFSLFGSRVDHRKRIGIENRRIGKQARSSGIIPLICLGHKPPRASRDEHEVRPDFSFPACTVRAIPFPVDFLWKVSRETKDMLTSSIPILSYPVFALRFAREPKEADKSSLDVHCVCVAILWRMKRRNRAA